MTTLYPSVIYNGTLGPHSSNLYDIALPAISSVTKASDPNLSGAKVGNGVVSEYSVMLDAQLHPSINWTFYNRVLIEPSLISLGNLMSIQVRQVVVWNGYLQNKTLSDFGVSGGDEGVSVDEPVVAPYAIRPLESLTYVLTVSMAGPPVVDSTLTWTVDSVAYSARVIGLRIVVFPFPANFRDDVTEGLEWKTDILRSFDGSEQRRALRTKARRGFEFKVTSLSKYSPLFRNILKGWQNRVFAFPVWPDVRPLAQAVASGAMALNVGSTTGYSFTAGGLGIVYVDPSTYEAFEIDSVTSTAINAVRPITGDWPKGTKVYPVVTGHMDRSVPYQQHTDTVLEAQISFIADPYRTDPYTPSAIAPATYDGKEVITMQPDWSAPLDMTADYAFDEIDFDTGSVVWFATETNSSVTRKYRWVLTSRAAVLAFRQFLERMRGRAKTCWIPSWTDDFEPLNTMGATDSTLTVADNGFLQFVGQDVAQDRIRVQLTDGTVFYRKILGVNRNLDGINTNLILDQSFGRIVTPAQFKTVNMLNLCRLSTDKVYIVWKSDTVATVDTVFTTVTA